MKTIAAAANHHQASLYLSIYLSLALCTTSIFTHQPIEPLHTNVPFANLHFRVVFHFLLATSPFFFDFSLLSTFSAGRHPSVTRRPKKKRDSKRWKRTTDSVDCRIADDSLRETRAYCLVYGINSVFHCFRYCRVLGLFASNVCSLSFLRGVRDVFSQG